MTVVSTTQDQDARTLTIVAELAAPPERVWQIWADPRQLERWWGPPTWPATFVQHDFAVGGGATYFMTGPGGDKAHGWWRFHAIDEPRTIEYEDGFADQEGKPDPQLPSMRAVVELVGTPQGTRMSVTTTFDSIEDMRRLVDEMQMDEGMTQAMGQIDAVLATT